MAAKGKTQLQQDLAKMGPREFVDSGRAAGLSNKALKDTMKASGVTPGKIAESLGQKPRNNVGLDLKTAGKTGPKMRYVSPGGSKRQKV